jgi:hypothetical protein
MLKIWVVNNMSKQLRSRQSGFGAIILLLMVVVIGVITVVSYHFLTKSHNKKPVAQTSNPAPIAEETASATDDTADWIPYANTAAGYQLKYPNDWVVPDSLDNCNPGLFMTGPTKNEAGRCGSESFGLVSVSYAEGDQSEQFTMTNGYKDTASKTVTIDSVAGLREVGTVAHDANDDFGGIVQDGATVVRYVFLTNNRTYTATYTQSPTGANLIDTFDKIVTKTLNFTK